MHTFDRLVSSTIPAPIGPNWSPPHGLPMWRGSVDKMTNEHIVYELYSIPFMLVPPGWISSNMLYLDRQEDCQGLVTAWLIKFIKSPPSKFLPSVSRLAVISFTLIAVHSRWPSFDLFSHRLCQQTILELKPSFISSLFHTFERTLLLMLC